MKNLKQKLNSFLNTMPEINGKALSDMDRTEAMVLSAISGVKPEMDESLTIPGVFGPIKVRVQLEMTAADAALIRAAGKTGIRAARAWLEEYLQAMQEEFENELSPLAEAEEDQDGPSLKVVKEDD